MAVKNLFVDKQNEAGYTLLESFIALSILLSMVMMIPDVVAILRTTTTLNSEDQEVILFFEQAEKEIQRSTAASAQTHLLELTLSDNKVISYEKYGSRIIRKVDGDGFELLVQNVTDFSASVIQGTVKLELTVNDYTYSYTSVMVQPISNQEADR